MAEEALRLWVSEHAAHDHAYWARRIGQSKCVELTTSEGTSYQAEIEVFWDDEPEGTIRVCFSLSGGSLRPYLPFPSNSLLVEPEAGLEAAPF